jgi:hypothetical protein
MILLYALFLWFFFFLLNYAPLTEVPAKWFKELLGPKIGYPLSCAACFAFWVTLALWTFNDFPIWMVPVAAVLHLFIDVVYTKLSPP